MKFAIWRHENSLGNSAEHTYGLYKHLLRNDIKNAEIYVEKDFQKCFAMCIPGVEGENIRFFDEEICSESLYKHPFSQDIHFPNVYREEMTYPSSWKDLSEDPDCTLEFPEHLYENKHNLPKDCILMQFRESGTFDKRVVGANEEPQRFVNIGVFFKMAEYYADKGYKVVRVGDKNQTPLPEHENIIDFAMVEDKSMMDDLFLISTCKAFVSCDSGIWPMAAALKKNLVLCNVTSVFTLDDKYVETNGTTKTMKKAKTSIVDWLPEETTRILYKKFQFDIPDKPGYIIIKDNSFDEIKEALESFL